MRYLLNSLTITVIQVIFRVFSNVFQIFVINACRGDLEIKMEFKLIDSDDFSTEAPFSDCLVWYSCEEGSKTFGTTTGGSPFIEMMSQVRLMWKSDTCRGD